MEDGSFNTFLRPDERQSKTDSSFGGRTYSSDEYQRLAKTLRQGLGPEYISNRSGPGGTKISYLEGWKATHLANEIFGFNGWSNQVMSTTVDFIDVENGRVSLGLSCIVRITLKDGCYREDVGYGSIENAKTKSAAFDKAKKEAVTDGMKRALKNLGSALGACLYDKEFLKKIKAVPVPQKQFNVDELFRAPEFRDLLPKAPAMPPPAQFVASKTVPFPTPITTQKVNGNATRIQAQFNANSKKSSINPQNTPAHLVREAMQTTHDNVHMVEDEEFEHNESLETYMLQFDRIHPLHNQPSLAAAEGNAQAQQFIQAIPAHTANDSDKFKPYQCVALENQVSPACVATGSIQAMGKPTAVNQRPANWNAPLPPQALIPQESLLANRNQQGTVTINSPQHHHQMISSPPASNLTNKSRAAPPTNANNQRQQNQIAFKSPIAAINCGPVIPPSTRPDLPMTPANTAHQQSMKANTLQQSMKTNTVQQPMKANTVQQPMKPNAVQHQQQVYANDGRMVNGNHSGTTSAPVAWTKSATGGIMRKGSSLEKKHGNLNSKTSYQAASISPNSLGISKSNAGFEPPNRIAVNKSVTMVAAAVYIPPAPMGATIDGGKHPIRKSQSLGSINQQRHSFADQIVYQEIQADALIKGKVPNLNVTPPGHTEQMHRPKSSYGRKLSDTSPNGGAADTFGAPHQLYQSGMNQQAGVKRGSVEPGNGMSDEHWKRTKTG